MQVNAKAMERANDAHTRIDGLEESMKLLGGGSDIDLSGYVKTDALNKMMADMDTKINGIDLSQYAKEDKIKSMFGDLESKLNELNKFALKTEV